MNVAVFLQSETKMVEMSQYYLDIYFLLIFFFLKRLTEF